MIEFLLVLALVCAILVIYPYLIYPRLLVRLPTVPVKRDVLARPSITLVFTAFNEARNMPAKLENIAALKARHPDLEVLAYDDGSSDNTRELLAARPNLVTVVEGKGRRGKAHGMKILAGRARGEVLVFTDANVMLREDALDNLGPYFGDSQVGGVCGALKYDGANASITANVGSQYWRLEERIKGEESRTGNVMGADGSIFAIRRALYPEFPDTVLDDLTVSMAVVFAGKRLIKAEDVVAHEGLVTSRSDEIARKIRIATRAFHTHLELRWQLAKMSRLDRFKYFSRKFLRWQGGGLLVLGTASFLSAMVLFSPTLGILTTLIVAAFSYLGVKRERGAVAAIMDIVTALVATQIGVVRAARGQTYVVWNPAQSR